MSRFDDNFDHDMTVIAERVTPSPTAWEEIQQRIADRQPTTETEIIMLTENTTTTRRWPLVAAAAAVATIAVGALALVNRGDDTQQPADTPEPSPTVAPAPDESGADLDAIPRPGVTIAPGRYSPDMLGVSVTLEVPDLTSAPWVVDVNNQASFSIASERGFVGVTRIGSFYSPDQAQDPDTSGLGSIPPNEVDTWIADNGIVVVDSFDATLGGRDAQFRQLQAPDGAGADLCPADAQPCILMSSGSADLLDFNPSPGAVLSGDVPDAFWIIDLADFEPLGIWIGAFDGDLDGWLDEIAPLLASIELGDPAAATDGGTARISTFGQTGEGGELPEAGQPVDAGTYSTDAVGTPMNVDIQDGQTGPWTMAANETGGIQLTSDDAGQEFIAIGRVGSWFDPQEARTESTSGLGSIAADGMDIWLAANDVIVVDSADVQVGGRDASYRLIRLDPTPGATADFCPAGEAPCLWAASGSADLVDAESVPVSFGRDRLHAVWSVDMGEYEPVFILAVANLDDDGPWFTDTVQPIVDSISFGEPAPAIEGGTARVPEQFTTTGAFEGARTADEPLADGTVPVTSEFELSGSLNGQIVGTGSATISEAGVDERGVDTFTFTGTIAEIGTGTVTYSLDWQLVNGIYTSSGLITDGTGDFAGATGTTTTSIRTVGQDGGAETSNGTITFFLGLPRNG